MMRREKNINVKYQGDKRCDIRRRWKEKRQGNWRLEREKECHRVPYIDSRGRLGSYHWREANKRRSLDASFLGK